jgi:site-specific recombinase XerD
VSKELPVVTEQQTVAQFFESHLAVIEPKLKPRTHIRYCDLVRGHALAAFGKVKLVRLSAQRVQELYATKLCEGLSPTTVHQLHVVLRSALKRAVRLGLVVRNVTDLVDAPRPKRDEIHPLSCEQARHLLDAAQGNRLEAL